MTKAGDMGWAILKYGKYKPDDLPENTSRKSPGSDPYREFGEPFEGDFSAKMGREMEERLFANDPQRKGGYEDHTTATEETIADLFLQTLTGFLEEGQEDYIMAEMANEGYNQVHPSEIEAGRRLALSKLSAMMMSSKFPPA